jgi:hypothetical protein
MLCAPRPSASSHNKAPVKPTPAAASARQRNRIERVDRHDLLRIDGFSESISQGAGGHRTHRCTAGRLFSQLPLLYRQPAG